MTELKAKIIMFLAKILASNFLQKAILKPIIFIIAVWGAYCLLYWVWFLISNPFIALVNWVR